MHYTKISTLLALALASVSYALPNPNPAAPDALALDKRCDECTKPQGSTCGGSCHQVSPNDIIKACGALNIDIASCAGLQGVLHGALGHHGGGGVDVNVDAAAQVDGNFMGQWGAICGYLGVPTTGVSITGSFNVGAAINVGAGIGGWLGGFIGGGGCGVCG